MIVELRHLFTIPYFTSGRGFCRGKSKAWFKRHGLDWRDFVRNGIDEQQLLDTGDGMAAALVKWAHECEARERADG